MLARLNWLFNRRFSALSLSETSPVSGQRSRLLIGLITLGVIAWLIIHYFIFPPWLKEMPSLLQETILVLEIAALLTLLVLWGLLVYSIRRGVKLSPLPEKMSVEQMYALSPTEFEQFVGQLFRQKGYRVRQRGASGDAGVDLELEQRNGKRAVVQCKRYRHTVGPDIVRELYGTLIHERAAHAFLVTTAEISDAAREWATGKPMTLIDGEALSQITAVLPSQPA